MGQSTDANSRLRRLPSVNALLEADQARGLLAAHPRLSVRDALRAALDDARSRLRDPDAAPHESSSLMLLDDAARRLREADARRLQAVVNATGIVLHTNLGRAVLADEAAAAVHAAATRYTNLELDLLTGKRGGRGGQTEDLLCALTGAEAALAVNNGAASVLLALSALVQGGDVIVSRGELVEIGGSFRIPDVIRQSGARLVEVGATNKTRIGDYEQAITGETKMLLKVHASNYRMIGFTSEASLGELVALGQARGLTVMQDLGSGALIDLSTYGLPREPTVTDAIKAGVDVVAFSGDKLLGGPQCGLLAGKASAIKAMARHPLFRALRPGKLTLAALEATLRIYSDEENRAQRLPVLRMLTEPLALLTRRARRLKTALSRLPDLEARIGGSISYAGGGTLPEDKIPSKCVLVFSRRMSAERLAEALRRSRPAVLCMVDDDQLVLDVRTIRDPEVAEIARAFQAVFP